MFNINVLWCWCTNLSHWGLMMIWCRGWMTMIGSWRDNCTCEMKIVCKLQHCDTASCLHPLFMPLATLCRATSHQGWACLLHDNTTVKCMFLKHRQHGRIVLVKNKLICSKSACGEHNTIESTPVLVSSSRAENESHGPGASVQTPDLACCHHAHFVTCTPERAGMINTA